MSVDAHARVLVVVLAFVAHPAAADREPATLDAVRAEFVERFTQYVDWPATALPAGGAFVMCVVRDPSIAAYLGRIARERAVKGRRAIVQQIDGGRLDGCHLLYLGDRVDHAPILARARRRPILTISATPGAARHGSIVAFFLAERRLRFELNPDAAHEARIELRSRLLRLGRLVERELP